jgi:hypothetical protein
MIIDARNAGVLGHGRPYTLSAAVSLALENIQIGAFVDVSGLKDVMGRDVPWPRLSMLVNKHKNGRTFMCRTVGSGVRVWRIT